MADDSRTPNISKEKAKRQKNASSLFDGSNTAEAREREKNLVENLKLAANTKENGVRYIEQVFKADNRWFISKLGSALRVSALTMATQLANQDVKLFNGLKEHLEYANADIVRSLGALKNDPGVVKAFGEEAGKITDGITSIKDELKKIGYERDAKGRFVKAQGYVNPKLMEQEKEKQKKEDGRFKKLTNFFGKEFNAVKKTAGDARDGVVKVKNSFVNLPKNLMKGLSKMAMAVPNGIVKLTTGLLGGAGKAIGLFIEGIGMGFKALGKAAGPIAAGAGVTVLIAGAIGAIGGAIWLVGKGIEEVMVGFGNGLKSISDGFAALSNTTINGGNIQKIAAALNGFLDQQTWNNLGKGVLANFIADLGKLGDQISHLSQASVDVVHLQRIGQGLSAFLHSFDGLGDIIGGVVTNIFNPENTLKFVTVLQQLKGVSLNTDQLVAVGKGMGTFLTSLNENSSLFDNVGASLKNFFTASGVFTDLATNVNALASIKTISKESADSIVYFMTAVSEPLSSLTSTGIFAQLSSSNYIGDFVQQIQQFDKLNLNRQKMEDAAAGIKAVGNMIETTFTQGFVDSLGRIMDNLIESVSGTQVDRVVDELNKFANIKGDFSGLKTLIDQTDKVGELKQAVYGLADALTQLSNVKPIGYDIGATLSDLNKVKAAADAARNAALAATINNVSNTNVSNANVTNAIPVNPTRVPSAADAALNRGR
jgi:hypothetical protein